jgi:hypothetical protein
MFNIKGRGIEGALSPILPPQPIKQINSLPNNALPFMKT